MYGVFNEANTYPLTTRCTEGLYINGLTYWPSLARGDAILVTYLSLLVGNMCALIAQESKKSLFPPQTFSADADYRVINQGIL